MTVILVAHILVSIVLVVAVLLQRSEGGALGMGGGGGGAGGGLVSGRGVAGALVRTTMIFGAIFFVTSLGLTTMAARNGDGRTAIERELDAQNQGTSADDALGLGDIDDILAPGSDLLGDPLATPSVTPPATPEAILRAVTLVKG